MLKRDLVNDLAAHFPDVAKKDLLDIVDVLFEEMARALEQGESVEIRGFGRLFVKTRAPIQSRNPRSGELVDVAKRWGLLFRPSEGLNTELSDNSKGFR